MNYKNETYECSWLRIILQENLPITISNYKDNSSSIENIMQDGLEGGH